MMKKENKIKSPFWFIVAGLVILSCVITGIYALYKSSDESSASADAAKWGVEITASGDEESAFLASYDGEDNISVQSADNESLVVGPGTSGAITFSITGTPEVGVDVSIGLGDPDASTPTLSMITGPSDAGASSKTYGYYPVKWTLKRSDEEVDDWSSVEAISGCSGKTLSEINAYLKGEDISKSVDANTDLSSTYGYYQLSWEWPASQSHDAEDTYIGNVAASSITDTNVCIKEAFKLEISVTQSYEAEND